MNILVTGGDSQVGIELRKIMPTATYVSYNDYNLICEEEVKTLFFRRHYHTVIHLAAKVGGIIDNINKPYDYFTDNILMNTNVLDTAKTSGVKRFIGILSTCAYPNIMKQYPMVEKDLHSGPPTDTNFSYGYAKRCMAVQIDACNRQYGTKYNYVIPCNLYSEHDKIGANSHFISALIQKIITAEKNNEKSITLFGDGSPLRQFIHAKDLANIIKKMIDDGIYENMNIASEELFSISEMAGLALKALGHTDWSIKYDGSKPNGQHRKDVSIKKFRQYFPDYKFIRLEDGIKYIYTHLKNQL